MAFFLAGDSFFARASPPFEAIDSICSRSVTKSEYEGLSFTLSKA
jgi:hypothetical protein